jgi:hypothetical protein
MAVKPELETVFNKPLKFAAALNIRVGGVLVGSSRLRSRLRKVD